MSSAGFLVGRPASTGLYRGYAQVCRAAEDFDTLPPGCVLVLESAKVPPSRLFFHIGALVAETGGVLSNALTVARERRIPAVVGADAATQMIRTGDELLVDGTRGLVRIVSAPYQGGGSDTSRAASASVPRSAAISA